MLHCHERSYFQCLIYWTASILGDKTATWGLIVTISPKYCRALGDDTTVHNIKAQDLIIRSNSFAKDYFIDQNSCFHLLNGDGSKLDLVSLPHS